MLRKKYFSGGMICYLVFSLLILETVISTYPQQRFDDLAHNVTVTEGKQAILPCQVDSDDMKDELLIIWMNPKRIVISERESRFIDDPRMSVERPFVGDYNLHIRNVRYDDRGEYTCTINTRPVQTKRIRLIVKVPSSFVHDGQSNLVTAIEGATVTLTCNATGIPAPNITWFRRIYPDEEEKEQVGTIGEVLIIHNISRHCGGIYECMAFNGVLPAISKKIDVEVHFKPEIIIRNRRLGQKKDKETMLECLVTASPQGDNYWKLGELEIHNNNRNGYRVEIYPEDDFTLAISLRILSVQDDDFGTYTCEAKNVLGVARDSMELYEYVVPTLPPTTIPTTIITTKRYSKYRTIPKNKKQKSKEKGPKDKDDQRYTSYGSHKDTQVSGHIGTGEYGNSADSVHAVYQSVLTLIVLILNLL